MNSPRIARRFAKLVGAMALLLACAANGHAQTLFYSSETTAATPPPTPAAGQYSGVQFLQLVTLNQGSGTYTLASFTIRLYNTSNAAQLVNLYLFSNVDTTSTNSPNVVDDNSYLGGFSGTVPAAGTMGAPVGNGLYTFTPDNPVTVNTNVFGVEVSLTTADQQNFADNLVGRFSTVAPNSGTSPGYVWDDADLDNNFASSEKTTFGQASAYASFSLSGTFSPAPEPGTWAMLAGGLVVVALAVRRRTA